MRIIPVLCMIKYITKIKCTNRLSVEENLGLNSSNHMSGSEKNRVLIFVTNEQNLLVIIMGSATTLYQPTMLWIRIRLDTKFSDWAAPTFLASKCVQLCALFLNLSLEYVFFFLTLCYGRARSRIMIGYDLKKGKIRIRNTFC